MDFELREWTEEDWEDYPHGKGHTHHRWVVISRNVAGNEYVVEHSSEDKLAAMGFMLNEFIKSAYDEWETELCRRFGLGTEVVEDCILDWMLTPLEKELIEMDSRPPEGLCEEEEVTEHERDTDQ